MRFSRKPPRQCRPAPQLERLAAFEPLRREPVAGKSVCSSSAHVISQTEVCAFPTVQKRIRIASAATRGVAQHSYTTLRQRVVVNSFHAEQRSET